MLKPRTAPTRDFIDGWFLGFLTGVITSLLIVSVMFLLGVV
jgi:hypothetical protein